MKSVLVPVEAHDLLPSVLQTALLFGRRFGSLIEGFALRPIMTEFIPVDMVGGLTWTQNDLVDQGEAERARDAFEAFMRAHQVPRVAEPREDVAFRWMDDALAGDAMVGEHGRVFDVTVVGRPTADHRAPRMSTLEAALFESGRPILIAPPTAPRSLGQTIVVAWNGSTETARAVAFALPLLRQAGRVVVLTVEGGMAPGPGGDQLVGYLRRNGIGADLNEAKPGRRSTGEAILATAAALDADLLVKGAYTQSRLRQMIFGGATSHILSAAMLPVFMAH
jgi:nucleotide-binding universal stress UspA family protein